MQATVSCDPVQSHEIDRLARSFADAAATFLGLVESLETSRWEEPSVEDGRRIGTIAHHVALGYAIGHWRVVAAASGGRSRVSLTAAEVTSSNTKRRSETQLACECFVDQSSQARHRHLSRTEVHSLRMPTE